MEALRTESLKHEGQNLKTTVLKVVYQGLEVLSWVDPYGRMVRQETPFGLTLVACTPDKILNLKHYAADMQDMLNGLAIPCKGCITNAAICEKLRVRLHGFSLDAKDLSSKRQIINAQETNSLELTLVPQRFPKKTFALGTVLPERFQPYLEATPALQSDNPAIARQANTIVANQTNAFEAAKAICNWVYKTIEKRPTISLPSAMDVLEKKEGDCNEHTYLFTALARAVSLPAQIYVGIVYATLNAHKGAFYYHAWPCVYVGEWVEMDPTLGQLTVDSTHISLAKGELANQMKLLGLLGHLSVDILTQENKIGN